MPRYSHLSWLAPLGGLVVAAVIAFSALPADSTVVCPTGVKPPSPYCTNVPPTARTGPASKVRATSATLNGVAGPNVRGGDITQYFFKYGTTTRYDSTTPTNTIGSCPGGLVPPSPYCNVPKRRHVSVDISDLTPCTRYHFQLFANNPDGSAAGGDRTFATGFAPPIAGFNAPSEVSAGEAFAVMVTLQYDADEVRISIGRNGTTTLGPVPAGQYVVTLRAPERGGNYILRVSARLACGRQRVFGLLRVHGQHHRFR
jgi:hypothetical protein